MDTKRSIKDFVLPDDHEDFTFDITIQKNEQYKKKQL